MSIPLDIEEILGSAVVTSIGRALAALLCLWLGAATGILGMHSGWALAEVLAGNKVDIAELAAKVMTSCGFGVLVLFGSFYFPLFFPLLFSVYFIFVRGENGTVKKWVVVASLTGLLALLSVHSWMRPNLLASALGFVMWLGFAGSLGMLAFLLSAWQRNRTAQHLMGVAAENDVRRQALAQQFGTAVGDREFATGDHLVFPAPGEASLEVRSGPPRSAD